ncbi:MAG: adenylate kinase [Candidatus Peribacter sp.]|jgi:adenylate kinase|nr:adenylate kinase [Candidatus Peribacter sp.]MBT4392558.1 adenylate kinase [Candidatus Peribacter sp.]MBT4601413.1 adenylate kinase [Candidatus Peribacter sp.]MBT5149122.1 adenylate kinase [Candidatus Peribacter sp.]MBT5638103.1 adenylate kinase [Candidatus Peribacter sp.]
MDLVFFGIQGSGKGTQAKTLAAELKYYIFEAGGELRKIKASGTDLGELVKKYIDNGELVPFEIIMEVVNEAVAAVPDDQKILFDGIPRDEDQMNAFDKILSDAGRQIRCVHILLDKDEAVERIKGRAEIEGRADDADQEKVLRRMDLFSEKTMPVIAEYESAGKVIEIDGKGSVEEIYARIKDGIADLN